MKVMHASAARAFVVAWVRCYTAGLPADLRDDRRAEIESDLWEQRGATAGSARFALSIAGRCLAGVPADLIWRMEHSGASLILGPLHAALSSAERCVTWLSRRGLPALPIVLAAFYLLLGALTLATASQNAEGTAWAIRSSMFLFAFGILVWAGWKLLHRHAISGVALLFAGAILPALIFAATIVVPVVTLAVFFEAARRARSRGLVAP